MSLGMATAVGNTRTDFETSCQAGGGDERPGFQRPLVPRTCAAVTRGPVGPLRNSCQFASLAGDINSKCVKHASKMRHIFQFMSLPGPSRTPEEFTSNNVFWLVRGAACAREVIIAVL